MLRTLTFLALAGPALGHSWIEYAYKVAANGTFTGDKGYPRGYLPRTSTDPKWTDSIPMWLLPYHGNSSYHGDEIFNKYTYEATPQYPMLEAAPGDHVALAYHENGHVTLPNINTAKPKNRGTVYLYGTSQPKEHEKLFDVHLLWNREGTGGDGRGRLLATRNFDDGQCFQPNTGDISMARAAEFASQGALHTKELLCQADVQLPDDLEPGSTYTVYWYWDWPDLDPEHIDLAATTDGLFPWAGTFMRGQEDPNGFTMNTIARNESYASVIDIKITNSSGGNNGTSESSPSSQPFANKGNTLTDTQWIVYQDIYSKAVKEQIGSNFLVDAQPDGAPSNGNRSTSASATTAPTSKASHDCGGSPATVTVTVTATPPPQLPTTLPTTLVTAIPKPAFTESDSSPPAASSPPATTPQSSPPTNNSPPADSTTLPMPVSTSTSTTTTSLTSHLSPPAATSSPPPSSPATAEPSTPLTPQGTSDRPAVTPFMRARRTNWAFGREA